MTGEEPRMDRFGRPIVEAEPDDPSPPDSPAERRREGGTPADPAAEEREALPAPEPVADFHSEDGQRRWAEYQKSPLTAPAYVGPDAGDLPAGADPAADAATEDSVFAPIDLARDGRRLAVHRLSTRGSLDVTTEP